MFVKRWMGEEAEMAHRGAHVVKRWMEEEPLVGKGA